MFLGLDLGTSAVKLILIDDSERVVATARRSIATQHPSSGRVEQAPSDWIDAATLAMDDLAAARPDAMAQVAGIGLSGQMHAALLLDGAQRPVSPAVLWNDSRADAEARELNDRYPALSQTAGVPAMAGFTGPKLLWFSRYAPEVLARAKWLCFPKDYLRLHLTGVLATDPTDAAGSWLFDQARRRWSPEAVAACEAGALNLPDLVESAAVAGHLDAALARRWGLGEGTPIVTGAGDVAAGAAGMGVVAGGAGLISLGTSAQVLVAREGFAPRPGRMVHSFCHVAPGSWFDMAALLNGTSALDAVAKWCRYGDVGALIGDVAVGPQEPGEITALPYLTGERTPHDNPFARAALVGMSPTTDRRDLARAMIEAIAFSLADGLSAVSQGASPPERLFLIGGGAQSDWLAQLCADVLGTPLDRVGQSDVGPAFGAARLARCGVRRESVTVGCPTPVTERSFHPDAARHRAYGAPLARYRALYQSLAPGFRAAAGQG